MEPVSKGNTFILVDQLLDQTGGGFLRSMFESFENSYYREVGPKDGKGISIPRSNQGSEQTQQWVSKIQATPRSHRGSSAPFCTVE